MIAPNLDTVQHYGKICDPEGDVVSHRPLLETLKKGLSQYSREWKDKNRHDEAICHVEGAFRFSSLGRAAQDVEKTIIEMISEAK